MLGNALSIMRTTLLASAGAFALAAVTATPAAAEDVGAVVDTVDETVEAPTDVVDEVVEVTDFSDQTGEVIDDKIADVVTGGTDPVPVEWVERSFEPDVMYSMMSFGGFEDNADDVASRAAEQAANHALDSIDESNSNTPQLP